MPRFRHQPDIPRVPTSIAQREYFREVMAREFESQADHLETLYAGWIEKGFSPATFTQCLTISIKVEALNQIAGWLRRRYYSRLEAESYMDAYPNRPDLTGERQDIHEER